jgi:hypothetical protein
MPFHKIDNGVKERALQLIAEGWPIERVIEAIGVSRHLPVGCSLFVSNSFSFCRYCISIRCLLGYPRYMSQWHHARSAPLPLQRCLCAVAVKGQSRYKNHAKQDRYMSLHSYSIISTLTTVQSARSSGWPRQSSRLRISATEFDLQRDGQPTQAERHTSRLAVTGQY